MARSKQGASTGRACSASLTFLDRPEMLRVDVGQGSDYCSLDCHVPKRRYGHLAILGVVGPPPRVWAVVMLHALFLLLLASLVVLLVDGGTATDVR